mgnify:CR=1 FL=1
MDKTIREDSESGDPKQGEADLTTREEGSEVQGTDATLVEGASDPVSAAVKVGEKLASAHKQFKKLQSNSNQARAKALEILQTVLEGIEHHEGVISSAYSKMASLKDSLEQQLGNGTGRRLLKELRSKLPGLCRWYEATYQAQAKQLNNLYTDAFTRHTEELDQLIEQDGTLPQNRLTLATLAYFYRGDGALKDLKKAFSFRKKMADQGDANAQNNLGWMYAKGEGVRKNSKEAIKWYRKAADQGDAQAQYNLGLMYSNGKGVPEDDVEAVKWYRKAADQGEAWGQYNLGVEHRPHRGARRRKKMRATMPVLMFAYRIGAAHPCLLVVLI